MKRWVIFTSRCIHNGRGQVPFSAALGESVGGVTGAGYVQCPVRGVGVTDGFLCNRNWQFLGTVGELEPRRQAPSVGER